MGRLKCYNTEKIGVETKFKMVGCSAHNNSASIYQPYKPQQSARTQKTIEGISAAEKHEIK